MRVRVRGRGERQGNRSGERKQIDPQFCVAASMNRWTRMKERQKERERESQTRVMKINNQ